MSELTAFTLTEARDAVASGSCSSVELTQAHLDQIASGDESIGSYLQVFADRALEQAAAALLGAGGHA